MQRLKIFPDAVNPHESHVAVTPRKKFLFFSMMMCFFWFFSFSLVMYVCELSMSIGSSTQLTNVSQHTWRTSDASTTRWKWKHSTKRQVSARAPLHTLSSLVAHVCPTLLLSQVLLLNSSQPTMASIFMSVTLFAPKPWYTPIIRLTLLHSCSIFPHFHRHLDNWT